VVALVSMHAAVLDRADAILLFSVALDLAAEFRLRDHRANYTGFAHILDVGAHLIMPAMTIGCSSWRPMRG